MPELPEVETLRRNLERTLVGRRFAEVSITLPKLFVSDSGLAPGDLVGREVLRLRRRAKFLILDLSDGLSLVVHLRMSGQLVHRASNGETLATGGHPVPAFDFPLPHRATHAIFRLDDGSRLYLTDIRQFGRLWLLPTDAVEELLERSSLGPEPLADEFTLPAFRSRLSRRPRAALKPLLLDQRFIVGVGNIYVDEIAFASRLSPLAQVGNLSPLRVAQLHRNIREVLNHAVTNGVADIRNGKANPLRDFPRVHGREGNPCPRCSTPIVKSRVAGRGTYTCPKCQRYPGPDA
jgi:formamidopyrimidine-DNA glycosylase